MYYVSGELVDQLLRKALSVFNPVSNKNIAPILIKYITTRTDTNFKTKATLHKYINPVICAVHYAYSIDRFTYDTEAFKEAWELVWKEIYIEGNFWPRVKDQALSRYYGSKGVYGLMLEVAYEIVQHIPTEQKNKSKQEQKKVQEIDKLYADVREYRSTKNFKELIDFIKEFPEQAPYNAMLIRMQNPGSRYVATAEYWQKNYNRIPKTGARPLVILKLFGPVSFVYDVSDTEGDPVPDEIVKPFKANGNTYTIFGNLMKNMVKEGIGYIENDYGSNYAGSLNCVIDKSYQDFIFPPKTQRGKTKYVPHEYDMVVNSKFNEAEKCATIFHELGHYFCGHIFHTKENKNVPERGPEIRGLNVREFEAETTCWILCERCGIENPSADYLNGYLAYNDEIPEGISIDTILKAAGKIESMMNRSYPYRERKNS